MPSERYVHEVAALTDWFKAQLPTLTDAIPELSRSVGTDSIESPQYRALFKRAFNTWLNERQYELSYNQMNIAFFAAYDSLH